MELPLPGLRPRLGRRRRGSARGRSRAWRSAPTGRRWVLLNASPDLRQQILATPALHPRGAARQSPIAAVVLTNGDVDHIAGLLTLRERQPFAVYASAATLDSARARNGVRRARPRPWCRAAPLIARRDRGASLASRLTAFAVPGKVPLFLEGETVEIGARDGGHRRRSRSPTDGRRASSTFPAAPHCRRLCWTGIAGADVLLFDGTTFTDDEMVRARPVAEDGAPHGPPGDRAVRPDRWSAWPATPVGRKVYIHINNTNPILVEGSPERRAVEAAGWEVAYDGMEIVL